MKEDKESFLLKEDKTEPLSIFDAQDYIDELEAQVKLLNRSKEALRTSLSEYQGVEGFSLVAKDFLMNVLADDDIVDQMVDTIEDSLDIQSKTQDAIYEYDFSDIVNDNLDTYAMVDDVVDSVQFESKVEDIVMDALSNVKLTVEDL